MFTSSADEGKSENWGSDEWEAGREDALGAGIHGWAGDEAVRQLSKPPMDCQEPQKPGEMKRWLALLQDILQGCLDPEVLRSGLGQGCQACRLAALFPFLPHQKPQFKPSWAFLDLSQRQQDCAFPLDSLGRWASGRTSDPGRRAGYLRFAQLQQRGIPVRGRYGVRTMVLCRVPRYTDMYRVRTGFQSRPSADT